MLYRTLTAFIVLFWLTMTALLIRSEVAPGESRVRQMPVAHVLKLLFLHEQASELNILYEKELVGRLRVQPQVRKEDGMRVIDFAGSVQLSFPGLNRERLSWSGSVEMTRQLELRLVRVRLSLRTPASYRVEFTHDPVARGGRYEVWSGEQQVMARDYVLGEGGLRALLPQLGLSPELLLMLQSALQGAGPPQPIEIVARQSALDLQGSELETNLVTFRQSGQTLLEVHIDQLGQVLRATTLLGYTLTQDGLQ